MSKDESVTLSDGKSISVFFGFIRIPNNASKVNFISFKYNVEFCGTRAFRGFRRNDLLWNYLSSAMIQIKQII